MFDAVVLDAEGKTHRLGDHLGTGPVLLVLLRHYGCIGCNQLVTHLGPRLQELHDLGFRTVFVGIGQPAHLAGFADRMRLLDKEVLLLTDPAGAVHGLAGLPRSVWQSLGPPSLRDHFQLLAEGIPPRAITGDILRMGGVMFLQDGREVWRRISKSPAGHPDDTEILQQALRLAMTR
jgi:peroxiredoxin